MTCPTAKGCRARDLTCPTFPPAALLGGALQTVQYVSWMLDLPWSDRDQDRCPPPTIAAARGILDEEHFGLLKVKRRILEHIAVRLKNPQATSPIICLVGPPGVGKTRQVLGRPWSLPPKLQTTVLPCPLTSTTRSSLALRSTP